MQMHEALQVRLQIARGRARDGGAPVVMAGLYHRTAVRVTGDRRRQFLRILDVGDMLELDRVVLRVEVSDCLPKSSTLTSVKSPSDRSPRDTILASFSSLISSSLKSTRPPCRARTRP
jgi:hypothetical protein